MQLTASEIARALAHGAPDVAAAFSVDVDGAVTFDEWPASGKPPTRQQLETWFLEVTAADDAAAANEGTLRDRADQALAQLQAAWDGWAGLTAAQKDATAKLQLRVVIALARLVLRKLDAA